MQIGVTFPQSEIGADPLVIRDYAQAPEGWVTATSKKPFQADLITC